MAWESLKGRECWRQEAREGLIASALLPAPVSVLEEACSRACWEMVGWSGRREDGAGAGGGGGERGGARGVQSLRI